MRSQQAAVRSRSRVEASELVEVGRDEVFHFTDWCYDVPEWFPPISWTRITKLPDPDGLGKVTQYRGVLMGREMEWRAESVEWKENECWTMKAVSGLPAKMGMALKLRFDALGTGRSKVTCVFEYRAPYPLVGSLIDRFYLRPEARRLVNEALDGLKRAVDRHGVPPLELQFEKRETDHPGYVTSGFHALRSRQALEQK